MPKSLKEMLSVSRFGEASQKLGLEGAEWRTRLRDLGVFTNETPDQIRKQVGQDCRMNEKIGSAYSRNKSVASRCVLRSHCRNYSYHILTGKLNHQDKGFNIDSLNCK